MNEIKELQQAKENDADVIREVIDRPKSVQVSTGIKGDVEKLVRFREEKERLNEIKRIVENFKRDHDRNLHLIESTKKAEDSINSLSKSLGLDKKETIERLLKVSISNEEIKEELAADLFLEDELELDKASNFLDKPQLDNLEIAKEQGY